MTKINWATWESVEDQSEYVNVISNIISQTIPLYNNWLADFHFRFFCDSFVSSFISKLIQSVYKCRRISEVGAEQILLDMTAIKTVLLDMPTYGSPAISTSSSTSNLLSKKESSVSSRYLKYTKKEMLRVEMILKVIITPQVGLVHSFKTLLTDSSETNFIKVMELKGIRKADQTALIESLRVYESQMKAEAKKGGGQ